MNDLDLEDIESHLYSQIYHSSDRNEEESNPIILENTKQPSEMKGKPNRYFQKNKKKPQTRGAIECLSKLKETLPYIRKDYSKDTGEAFTSLDVPFSQAFCSKNKVKEKRKRQRTRAKLFKLKRNIIKQITNIPRQLQQPPQEIITLSDTDDDSCMEISKEWPLVSVTDSDDEKKDKQVDVKLSPVDTSDDVIFVEPSNTSVEIINIDEDTNLQKSPEEVSTHNDVETASVTSSCNSFINAYSNRSPSVKNPHRDRKELLRTPDSASNDFISNTGINTGKKDFNFSLHGKDFSNEKFVKPNKPSEAYCETESSSSATDQNNLNTMKTIVFNEVEFPKEGIFAEANLETFSNFITPLRKSPVIKKAPHCSTPVENMSPSHKQNLYSSDSSSESDFEGADSENVEISKKTKNLPELSPMLTQNTSLQAVKKNKKNLNISSKYDLVNANLAEGTKPAKQKKRKSGQLEDAVYTSEGGSLKKKKKKRRTDANKSVTEAEESLEDSLLNNSLQDNSHDDASDTDSKQKRKKSREVLDEMAENSEAGQSKKKTKTKKKKSFSEEELIRTELSVQLEGSNQEMIIDNTETSPPVVKTEVNSTHELIHTNSHIRFEEINEQLEKEVAVEFPTIKIEQLDEKPENKEEEIQMKRELPDDLIVLEEVYLTDKVYTLSSSDSDTKLSPLRDQQDIQLLNLEEPSPQEPSVPIENPTGKINLMHCSVAEVQHSMSNDPKMWTILETDRMPPDKNNLMNRRCNKCREKGHMAIRCPNQVVPKCRLCGETGHYEPRCPNRICTQCGTRRHYSTNRCQTCLRFKNHQCNLCLMTGHPAAACPDLWRRYHMTTTEGPLRYSLGPLLKPKHKLWCSGCARSGHLQHSCRYYQSIYPPSDPRIKSYIDVYQLGFGEVGIVEQPLYFGFDNNFNADMQQTVYQNQSNFGMNSYAEDRATGNSEGNFGTDVQQTPMQNAQFHEFYFEDNLPNYISFDSPNSAFDNMPRGFNFKQNVKSNLSQSVEVINPYNAWRRRGESFFLSDPVLNLRQLILKEFQILNKKARFKLRIVKELRKQMTFQQSKSKAHNRMLNMLLFGIYKLQHGGKHLNRLRHFIGNGPKKLNNTARKELFISYCYVFGNERHSGLDYAELLSRL